MAKTIASDTGKNSSTDNIFSLFLFNFDIPENIHVRQMSDHEVINDWQLEALCEMDSRGQNKPLYINGTIQECQRASLRVTIPIIRTCVIQGDASIVHLPQINGGT